MDIDNNTVSAENQVHKSNYVGIFCRGGDLRVLFVGNSITRHEPNIGIGWDRDWGMAASTKDLDYVHTAVRLLDEEYGKVDYCITNCGRWELSYFDDGMLSQWSEARDFSADIVVLRLGENINKAKEHFATHNISTHYKRMAEFFMGKGALVIATGLFWRNDEIERAIEAAAEELGAVYLPLWDLGEADENMALGLFSNPGVAMHPGDIGMARIAERIVSAIKKAK